jgi:hypothetical protein
MPSSFKLDVLKKLEHLNDPNFSFDSRKHRYTYNGTQYTSVTTFLKNFTKPFDNEFRSQKKSEESGFPKEWIQNEWKNSASTANNLGTCVHLWIENYFNKVHQDLPTDLEVINRINKFNNIYAKHLYKLEPVKFETRIFSKKYPLAGTIDSLFLYKSSLIIIDYKTNADFKHDGHPKGKFQKLLEPFEEYYSNHLNDYSIQIALYSLILREWGLDVKGGYLLHIGPEDEAVFYKTHNFVDKLEKYLENYKFKKKN